jgi:hypothetical protein
MGDVPLSTSSPANGPFSAGQLFDAQSVYSRMRASLKPDAKLQGFFHYLAVQAKNRARDEVSRPPGSAGRTRELQLAPLVLAADDPDQELPAQLWSELADRFGGKRFLQMSFQLKDASRLPAAPAVCRAFFLTPGVVQRLCGPEATRGAETMRRALLEVFAGRGRGDPFETARILAAVPELDGKVDDRGFCKFRPVELPEQAQVLDGLPEHTAVVIVIDRPARE